jgi:hypothetical protein
MRLLADPSHEQTALANKHIKLINPLPFVTFFLLRELDARK